VEVSIGLGTHLFVEVPRPGDSEVTFSVFIKLSLVTKAINLTIQR